MTDRLSNTATFVCFVPRLHLKRRRLALLPRRTFRLAGQSNRASLLGLSTPARPRMPGVGVSGGEQW